MLALAARSRTRWPVQPVSNRKSKKSIADRSSFAIRGLSDDMIATRQAPANHFHQFGLICGRSSSVEPYSRSAILIAPCRRFPTEKIALNLFRTILMAVALAGPSEAFLPGPSQAQKAIRIGLQT